METTRYGAAVTEQLSALTLITCLLAFSGARHFLAATIPPREREALTVAFGLYFLFGTVTDLCASTGTTPPLICGVFSLSYYVIRILLIFCILIFFNMAADTIRRSSGHSWPHLKGEILRLVAYRQLRLRVLVVYLVLPIVFMFMEVYMRCCCKRGLSQTLSGFCGSERICVLVSRVCAAQVVLDWKGSWLMALWRDALDLYMLFALVAHITDQILLRHPLCALETLGKRDGRRGVLRLVLPMAAGQRKHQRRGCRQAGQPRARAAD